MQCVKHVARARAACERRRSRAGTGTISAIGAALVFAFASHAGATTFRPDPSFGTGGTLVLEHPGVSRDVAVQSSGRLVVLAADETQQLVLGLSPDGAPDTSFGDGGVTALPGTASWNYGGPGRVVVDDGDRIVVSGRTADATLFVARLLADGTPDVSFGDEGMTEPPQAQCLTDWCRPGPSALALDQQGRILVATTWEDAAGTGIALLRVTRDGMLDATFGSGGVARAPSAQYDRPGGIAIAADGRIFAVATRVSAGGIETGMVLAAFTPDGAIDASFAHGGTVVVTLPGGGSATDVALDARGRLVVVGSGHPAGATETDVMVQRWLPSGTLDRSFGARGIAFGGATDFGRPSEASGTAVDIAPDGTIIATGYAQPSEVISPCAFFQRTALATFSASGAPGAHNTNVAPGAGFSGTTLLADGALVGVATRFPPCHVLVDPPVPVLVRLLPIPDPTTPPGPVRIRPRGSTIVPGGLAR